MSSARITLTALEGLPLIEAGDDLAALIVAAIDRGRVALMDKDVLVVAQKIVSKAEGRFADLSAVRATPRAEQLASETGKDPRLVEVILSESKRVLRHRPNVLIVEHRQGYVMANAGVDRSNVGPGDGAERVLLLPSDPDAAAEALRARLTSHFGRKLAIVINDSFGRAWRRGTVGVALGAAGLPSLQDLRGRADLFGRQLQVTEVGFADEIAAAASLVMGQADEGRPVVLVSGLDWDAMPSSAATLIRDPSQDLFG